MTQEQRCAFLIAQAAVLNAKVFGMQAENMQRAHRGESMAHTEQSFQNEIDGSICAWNAAIDYLRG